MDTIAPKTPDPLPLAEWQALQPEAAAREVHSRVAALPAQLRHAALAWLKPEPELARDLRAARESVGASSLATSSNPVASEVAPTSLSAPSLRGVPYLIKDLFDLTGVPTRAGSTFLDKVRSLPTQDSHFVRTLSTQGAVAAGKTHLVEFASGLTGENPHYGDCPHPRFPARLSGGSSSGSAALVAAGVTPLSLGTDTGGSVRVPAAWCGLHGFRLSPGDAFIRDAFPLAPTMDTAGWFTGSARDMLAVWQAFMGRSTRAGEPPPSAHALRGCYLNARAMVPGMDPAVATACDAAAAELSGRADAATESALLQSWSHAVDSYVSIGMSEAHAIHRNWLGPYHEHYDPVIWRRFTDAGQIQAEEIARARAQLTAIRASWSEFFRTFDFLVLPAVPCAAPTKAGATAELRRHILTLTAPASLGGLPVLTLPVPLPAGLTAGLQIVLPRADSPVVPALLQR
jgi:Asp-tRNA(Asn)/Glu-tRNA(Gln) amidotransferase A subunit family amidase